MGLFWDLIQQGQISDQRERATGLEQRVGHLEDRLDRMERLFQEVLQRLESALGQDLDQDGRIG
jgi:hypothetical protein